MADAYAMSFSYKKTNTLYLDNLDRCSRQDFSKLQELHALLCAHKSVSTMMAFSGME